MALSVDAAFNEFIANIRGGRAESAAAASHRVSIRAKLESTFGMTAFFRTGSFGNGTNVFGYSDVDYFAVIPTENLKLDSSVSLAQVAAALRERFPTTEGIRVDSPGVRIPFGLDGAEMTEIVPVDHTGYTLLNFRKFDMPDGNGGWKFAAPESHNAYVRGLDDRLNGGARRLARLLKAWKFYRGVPIKSFFIEMFVARYCANETQIIYDIDVSRILADLAESGLYDMHDPRFPNDDFWLSACGTDAQRQEALAATVRASRWASDAVSLRLDGKVPAAFERWDLVYDYAFPSYG